MAKASPLASVAATREVLERHGAWTKHGLGQNFLVNDDVVRRILELSAVGPDDVVLEVGPGIGTLTCALLAHARHVVAVEKDPALPPILADTLAGSEGRLTLLQKDALALSAADFPPELSPPGKLVANLPYAVAATLVLGYFERFAHVGSATVMVQKEVADRICAQPGSKAYGAYTVKLGLYAEPVGRFAVGPGNFFPPPRVDSAVIRLNRRVPLMADGVPASPEVIAAAALMADAAFTNRRKTIANSCKIYFSGRGPILLGVADSSAAEGAPGIVLPDGAAIAERLAAIFDAATIDPRRRGETLTQQEFLALGAALLKVTAA